MVEKSVIVTGSIKGIGLEIAKRFLEEGYFVIFNYATDYQTAKELDEELQNTYFNQYVIIQQKIEDKYDVESFVKKCLAIINKFDVIVCNAACTDRSDWDNMGWDSWMRVMNTNLNAPAYLLQLLHKHIVDHGNIIFIGSILGIHTHAISVPYSVSKGAVHTLTKALVKVYAERGIRVNAVAPGFVDTLWQKNKPQKIRENICDKVALHRFAYPEEIADCVLNIVNNGYINGTVLEVDGGYCYK